MSEEQIKRTIEEERVEGAVLSLLRGLGWLPPLTEGRVAEAEREIEVAVGELPEVLSVPQKVMEGSADEQFPPSLKLPRRPEVEATLARAAREGKAIPPEVEARMRQDRARAEQDQRDECHGEDDR